MSLSCYWQWILSSHCQSATLTMWWRNLWSIKQDRRIKNWRLEFVKFIATYIFVSLGIFVHRLKQQLIVQIKPKASSALYLLRPAGLQLGLKRFLKSRNQATEPGRLVEKLCCLFTFFILSPWSTPRKYSYLPHRGLICMNAPLPSLWNSIFFSPTFV